MEIQTRCDKFLTPSTLRSLCQSLVSCFSDVAQFRNFVFYSSSRRIRDRVLLNSTIEDAASSLIEACCARDMLDEMIVDLAGAFDERQDLWHLAWEVVSLYSDGTSGTQAHLRHKLASMSVKDTVAELDTTTGLEAVTSVDPFLDAKKLSDWANRIKKQVCQIRCGDEQRGTGFLVAPDLVLTCHHVVGSHLSENSRKDISVRFDYLSEESSVDWLPVDPNWSIPSAPPSDTDKWPDRKLEPKDHELDFAVLRLSRPEGSTRGFVEVSDSDSLPIVGTPVLVAGHPGPTAPLQPLRVSLAAPGFDSANANRTRIAYKASTLKGSSGSPVFDRDFQPLALHHNFGEAGHGGLRRNNRGIPLFQICRRLAVSKLADLSLPNRVATQSTSGDALESSEQPVSTASRLTVLSGELPFIGRDALKNCIRQVCSGIARVLLVSGKRNSGRTISAHFVQMIANERREKCLPMSVVDWHTRTPLTPIGLTEEMAAFYGWSHSQLNDIVASGNPKVARQLAFWVAGRCKEETRPIWLVYDDCDESNVQDDMRHFLTVLIKQVVHVANMRVVLLGDSPGFDVVAPGFTAIDTIRPPSKEDCESFLEQYAVEIGKPLGESTIRSVVNQIWQRLPQNSELFLRVLSLEMQVQILRMRAYAFS